MKYIFYLCLFFAVNVYAQQVNLTQGHTKSKDYLTEINFEFIEDKIIVPVEIEGKTYRFLLDTGAPNIISQEVFDIIQPEILTTIIVSDANNKNDFVDVVSIKELNFGDIIFENTASLVYDFNANPLFKCFGLDGFIGSNMLVNSIIQIDLKQKTITFTDNNKKLKLNNKNSSKIKLISKQKNPFIWIKVEGEGNGKEQVLIDTGMAGLYDISLKNYNIFKKKKIFNPMGESEGASTIGIFGDSPMNTHTRLHVPAIKINGLEINNYITHTTNDNNSRIGSEILKYGVVTIDYKNKRFYVDSTTEKINISKPELNFTKTFKDNKLIIGFVWDDELKTKINYGDEILEIDGKKIVICDIILKDPFEEVQKSIRLKIKPTSGEIFELEAHYQIPNFQNL